MESRYRLFGHSIHMMIVPFAVGLLGSAAVFDAIALAAGLPKMAELAYWLISGGLVVGSIATPFGFLDWMETPDGSRAESLGRLHGTGNVVVLLLFAGSWLMRSADPAAPAVMATVLSFSAVALTLITAWMGGELVTRLGMGVSAGAGPNASSSLLESSKAAVNVQDSVVSRASIDIDDAHRQLVEPHARVPTAHRPTVQGTRDVVACTRWRADSGHSGWPTSCERRGCSWPQDRSAAQSGRRPRRTSPMQSTAHCSTETARSRRCAVPEVSRPRTTMQAASPPSQAIAPS